MAKKLLSAFFVKSAKHSGGRGPDKYWDAHGLILRVMPSGSKQWIWRGTIHGKRRDLGLGSYPYTSLSKAREKALEYRKLARDGGDPAAEYGKRKAEPTFTEALERVLEIQRGAWRNSSKSEKQWRASLEAYALPRIGDKRVSIITAADVLSVLFPIWNEKRETARRVRQRIGAVMKYAITQGYRQDDPAANVTQALPKNGVHAKHFKAVPYAEVGAAIEAVRESDAGLSTKLLFEFIALTAVRSGEARKATWVEIDYKTLSWVIPAERVKTHRELRVPLSTRVREILIEAIKLSDGSGLIFPGSSGRVLSNATLSKLVRELGIPGTVHGLRSTFRDWASEQTSTPRAVMESALGHAIKDKAEAAYARSDLFDKRKELMQEWADYITEGEN